jgi:hypothetical protein
MYTGQGMDESLFTEALENAEQVSESYHQAVVL